MLGGSLLQAALQIVLLLLDLGPVGYMAGALVGTSVSLAIGLLLVRDRLRWKVVSWPGDFVAYAARVLPATVANRLLVFADRLVLFPVGSLESFAVYALAARVMTPMKLASGGLKLAFGPALARAEGAVSGRARAALIDKVHVLAVLAMLEGGVLLVAACSLLRFTPWAPHTGTLAVLVAVLFLAQLLLTQASLLQIVMYYSDRPHASAYSSTAAVVTLMVGLVVLVPWAGAHGAALAELGSGLVSVGVALAATCRSSEEWRRHLPAVLLAVSFLPVMLIVWAGPWALQAAALTAAGLAYGAALAGRARREHLPTHWERGTV
jgi:O-antigen/teichoic acid export membrane protein